MKARFVVLLVIIVIVILFILGSSMSEQCISIGEDKACWKTTVLMINSTLCPNTTQPCLAKPELQQYNAIADLLLKACNRAKAESYSNTERAGRIEEVVSIFMGMNITASQLCEQPGMLLTYRMYE